MDMIQCLIINTYTKSVFLNESGRVSVLWEGERGVGAVNF